MMKVVSCFAVAVILVALLARTGGADTKADGHRGVQEGIFPPLTATNLEGITLSLPADFAGERNLLLIAFQREQQKNVDTWLHQMKRFDSSPGFRYYELPTIDKLNPLVRWFINSGMRRGIPDHDARARTFTLYIDKPPFLNALNIADEKQIYAILIDRSGRVLWRAEGDFDEARGASLQEVLTRGRL